MLTLADKRGLANPDITDKNTYKGQHYRVFFSPPRPSGPSWSSSRNVCLYLCLSPFHVVYFEAYFSPTSRSRMSKGLRDSESLGKNAGKK